jgi:hypothetical protein
MEGFPQDEKSMFSFGLLIYYIDWVYKIILVFGDLQKIRRD